jgi:hypothetical protein
MVVCKVDDAEAADSEHPKDLEFGQAGTGRKRMALRRRRYRSRIVETR